MSPFGEVAGMVGLGERLRRMRESRGWSRYRLALLSGLTGEGIGKLEEGESADPRLSTLVKLAGAFGVKVCELLPEAPPSPQPARKKRPGKAPRAPGPA
jgi:transcriptional regulator with XRE-family HTH domain